MVCSGFFLREAGIMALEFKICSDAFHMAVLGNRPHFSDSGWSEILRRYFGFIISMQCCGVKII